MKEKINVEVEMDSEDLVLLRRLSEKLDLRVGELLMQEVKERLIEMEIWEARFRELEMRALS